MDEQAYPDELLGRWRMARRITDRRGPDRTVDGTLSLDAVGPGRIDWHEDGTMTWPQGRAEVSRDLVLTWDSEAWMVRFSDGREFHPWRPGSPVCHPCGNDVYDGLVTIDERDADGAVTAWSVRWDVTGPAKDYTMVSHLTRLAKISP